MDRREGNLDARALRAERELTEARKSTIRACYELKGIIQLQKLSAARRANTEDMTDVMYDCADALLLIIDALREQNQSNLKYGPLFDDLPF